MTKQFPGVVKFRLLILAAAVGLLSVGLVQLDRAPVDVLPEFTPPYAEIQTEALGLSAQEVEQLITVPLEADLLNGVEGVDVIRSESLPGLSSIVLVFQPDADVYRARQLVEERLTQAHALPNVSKPPTLLQPLSSSNRVLMIGLSSAELTPIEQSVIARWTVRPRLMGVPGVANVSVWGMRDQQLQVQVDPEQLRDRKVTLGQVITTAGNAQVVSPLSFLEASTPGTGGFVETPQQRLQVRHLLEKIADPAELAKVPVEGTDGDLQLGDIATIAVDHQPLIGDAVVNGGPGLVLVVEKFPGASTPEVTAAVEEALETLKPGLTGIEADATVFRPADYLEAAKANLGLVLAVGAALALVGLLACRFSWRTLLVVAVAVPLAMVTAAVVLLLLGQGINALVLAGLAAAVAVVVDAAVAPTRRSLVYATLVAALAVVPVAVLQGRPGAFLTPLVLSYLAAVAAAVLVALTVTPALTSLLAGRSRRTPVAPVRPSRLRTGYETALRRFSATARPLLLVGAAAAVVALALLPFRGTALLPTFADPAVAVRLTGQPGVSAALMTQKTTEVARALQALPGVESAVGSVGRAVTGDRVVNVSSSDVWVTISADADHDQTRADIEDAVAGVPDVTGEVVSASAEALRDVGALRSGVNRVTGDGLDVLTGLDHPLAVRLYGQDPAVLAEQAEHVRATMAGVEGVVNPVVEQPATEPTIEIEVDLERAQQVGITPGAVRRAEATLLQGVQVGSVFEDQKVFDVVVQGTPATRQGVDAVRDLLIDRPGGGHVRLGDVAEVRVVPTPSVISREAVSRRLDVVAGIDGRDVADVAAELKSAVAGLTFPLEYHAEVLTPSTADEIGLGRVVGTGLAAALAVLLLLQAAFRSWRLAVVGCAALALALVGGLVTSLVTGWTLGLGSLLGLLAVFALAARTVVAMVETLQAADGSGEARTGAGLAAAAGSRVAPVAGTAVVLALLALPVLVAGPRPGLELLFPFAVVLLGGLVSTLLVTLFWLPAAYRNLAPAPEEQAPADEQPVSPTNGQHHDGSGNGWHPPDRELASSAATSGQARP